MESHSLLVGLPVPRPCGNGLFGSGRVRTQGITGSRLRGDSRGRGPAGRPRSGRVTGTWTCTVAVLARGLKGRPRRRRTNGRQSPGRGPLVRLWDERDAESGWCRCRAETPRANRKSKRKTKLFSDPAPKLAGTRTVRETSVCLSIWFCIALSHTLFLSLFRKRVAVCRPTVVSLAAPSEAFSGPFTFPLTLLTVLRARMTSGWRAGRDVSGPPRCGRRRRRHRHHRACSPARATETRPPLGDRGRVSRGRRSQAHALHRGNARSVPGTPGSRPRTVAKGYPGPSTLPLPIFTLATGKYVLYGSVLSSRVQPEGRKIPKKKPPELWNHGRSLSKIIRE